jgi:stress-induced-phosphoprotein 1
MEASEYKAKANEAFKNGDYAAALNFNNLAIEKNPTDHVLYSNRSGCYASLNQFDEALDDANKCIKINPTFVKGYSRKGTALEGLGFFDQAILAYDDGLKIDANSDLLLERKAECEVKMGGGLGDNDFSGGMPDQNMQQQLLMKLLSNPETASLFQDPDFLSKFAEVQKNPANMMKYMSDPRFAKVFSALSGRAPQEDDFEKLGKRFGETPTSNAQPKQSESKPASNKMDEEYIPRSEPKREDPKKKQVSEGEGFKEKGNEYYKKKDFVNADIYYQKAIDAEKNNLLFRSNLIASLIEQNNIALAKETCDEAIKVYSETEPRERQSAHLAKIYARYARIHEIEENLDEAIAMYNKSLLEDKQHKVSEDLKKAKQMKKTKDEQAYLNPELGDQARDRGNELFKNGKFAEALIQYEEAVKRNPTDAKSYNNRATCYVKLMEFNYAMKEVDKALELQPNFTKALVRKASIHHVIKEYHKAIEVLERCLQIDPEDASALEQMKKTRQAISGEMHSGNDEERLKRAMADPEIQQIMMDPMLKIALSKMQQDPKGASEYFMDPNLGPKLQKLIQAGVLKVA